MRVETSVFLVPISKCLAWRYKNLSFAIDLPTIFVVIQSPERNWPNSTPRYFTWDLLCMMLLAHVIFKFAWPYLFNFCLVQNKTDSVLPGAETAYYQLANLLHTLTLWLEVAQFHGYPYRTLWEQCHLHREELCRKPLMVNHSHKWRIGVALEWTPVVLCGTVVTAFHEE